MKNKIKEILKKNPLIVMVYEGCVKITKLFKETDLVKRYTSIGKGDRNRGKKFFLITSMLTGGQVGLYSTILVIVLPYMDFAIRKGWIPIIDLRPVNMPLLQDEDKYGIENSWEYYYKQPMSNESIDELYQNKCVIDAWYWRKKVKHYDWRVMCPTDKKNLKYWNTIITSYLKLTDDLENRLVLEREKIFKSGRKVLGVGVRAGLRAGVMRNDKLHNNHPKQPTCEELMDIVEDKMRMWGCDYIFISCDDREYFNKFRIKWGDRCCFVDRERVHFFENDAPVPTQQQMYIEFKDVATRKKNADYIIETYLLAQCSCYYSSHGGGTTFAYFLNGGKYEHVEVYDKGVYSVV